MGADLMLSINEMEATKEEAYKNAEHLTRPERLSNTLFVLVEEANVGRWGYYDDLSEEEVTSEELYKYLVSCIDEVYDSQRRRDCGVFYIDHRTFYITAGMSWGDEPTDAWESFVVCEYLGLTHKQPLDNPSPSSDTM